MGRVPKYHSRGNRRQDVRYIDKVDENDNDVGIVPYDEAHKNGYWHRTVHVLVFDNADLEHILLQLRSGKKKQGRLQYQSSAAGHVDEGESYRAAAYRETREELAFGRERLPKGLYLRAGVKIKNKTRFGSGNDIIINSEHVQVYYAISPDGQRTSYYFDREETDALLWRPTIDIISDLENDEKRKNYTPDFRNVLLASRGAIFL